MEETQKVNSVCIRSSFHLGGFCEFRRSSQKAKSFISIFVKMLIKHLLENVNKDTEK